MNRRTWIATLLLCALLPIGQAVAQDLSNMFGIWKLTSIGLPDHAVCGEVTIVGELWVMQRVTDDASETYKGTVSSRTTYKHCPDSGQSSTTAFPTVMGDAVNIFYTGEGWEPDFLERKGDVLEGFDGFGNRLRWVKVSGPSDSDRADFARSNIAKVMYDESSDQIRAKFRSKGDTASNVESKLRQYFDDMANCEVDALSMSAAEQSLSFYELINLVDPVVGGMSNIELYESFETASFRARKDQCQKIRARML